MSPSVHVIIVTHNSSEVISLCLRALAAQTHAADSITIVDSGSDTSAYLDKIRQKGIVVIQTENVGFAGANNIGFQSLKPANDDIVVFLNPDAFLHENAVAEILGLFNKQSNAGCVTGKLLGYDLKARKRNGLLDSTGIFRKWYGRWYDRGQGQVDRGLYDNEQEIPAVCGALMCCRMQALEAFKGAIFDTSFFLYKEDIELSLRIRKNGWTLLYSPLIIADHCRGWREERRSVPYSRRLSSAENEVKLYCRHPSIYMVWALAKYLAVRLLRL